MGIPVGQYLLLRSDKAPNSFYRDHGKFNHHSIRADFENRNHTFRDNRTSGSGFNSFAWNNSTKLANYRMRYAYNIMNWKLKYRNSRYIINAGGDHG